jgi:hypothetical protein
MMVLEDDSRGEMWWKSWEYLYSANVDVDFIVKVTTSTQASMNVNALKV